MSDPQRFTDPQGGFEIVLPAGWTASPDAEEGGVELSHPDGAGVLHLIGIPQPDDEFPDPAEELYAFLEDRGVELEEDEVEDLILEDGAEMALCEFVSEDEEEGDRTFWMVGVATSPGHLVFATYFCAAGEEEEERAQVVSALHSLRLVVA